MNALDVLVTPRAPTIVPASSDAAPAGDADPTAAEFIALLSALLGKAPVIPTPAPTLSLVTTEAEGEVVADADGAAADADLTGNAGDVSVEDAAPVIATGTTLVTDSEMVSIARAALAVMRRGGSATKAAATAGPAVAAHPLARLMRHVAPPVEKLPVPAPSSAPPAVLATTPVATGELVDTSIEEATPVANGAAADQVLPQLVDATTTATPAPPAAVAQAIAAASAAPTPVAMSPAQSPVDLTELTERPVDAMSSTRGASLTANAALSRKAGGSVQPSLAPNRAPHASAAEQDSALVTTVMQLIESLLHEGAATETAMVDAVATTLPAPDGESVASLPLPGSAALPAGVKVVEIQGDGAPSIHPTAAVAPETTATAAPSAAAALAASVEVPEHSDLTTTGDALSEPADSIAPIVAPRKQAAAPTATATTQERHSDSEQSPAQEHAANDERREHGTERTSESAPRWSPAPSAAPGAANAVTRDAPVSETIPTRAPAEPTRAPQATSHVTLQLDQDTLGASRVRVAVRGDMVRATIHTEESKVAQLNVQLPALRRALEERGFTEARVFIQVDAPRDGQGPVIAGAVADDMRARPAAATRSESGRDEQQPRGGRRQDADGDRPRDRRRQAPKEEGQ